MLDWFRSWHGAPTDDKWLVIAKRSGVPAIMIPSIAWALFDFASQAEDRGSVAGFDFETYAMKFNIEEDQVRAVYTAMEAKEMIVGGRIAQWEKRQPKREDTSTERMREHRSKKKEASAAQPEISGEKTDEPPHATPLISAESMALAEEVAVIAGHDLKFVPPAWCGAASRVQVWLANGWPPEIIRQSSRAQMHRKRDGPPDSIRYFEKGIAAAIASNSAPLPTVVPFPSETVQVRNGRPPQSPLMAAADRLIAELESGDGATGKAPVGLLPVRG